MTSKREKNVNCPKSCFFFKIPNVLKLRLNFGSVQKLSCQTKIFMTRFQDLLATIMTPSPFDEKKKTKSLPARYNTIKANITRLST